MYVSKSFTGADINLNHATVFDSIWSQCSLKGIKTETDQGEVRKKTSLTTRCHVFYLCPPKVQSVNPSEAPLNPVFNLNS